MLFDQIIQEIALNNLALKLSRQCDYLKREIDEAGDFVYNAVKVTIRSPQITPITSGVFEYIIVDKVPLNWFEWLQETKWVQPAQNDMGVRDIYFFHETGRP